MELFKKIDGILYKISSVIVGVLMIFLTISTLTGVFFRFILGHPLAWVYEASIVSFSWIIFVGVAMAFKNHEHMSLEFVVENLKPKSKYILLQTINIICIIFMIVGMYQALKIVGRTWGQKYNTIPIRSGVFYLSFPIGAIAAISHLLMRIITLKERISKDNVDKEGVAV